MSMNRDKSVLDFTSDGVFRPHIFFLMPCSGKENCTMVRGNDFG